MWFDYYLADRLKMSVGQVREMPHLEYVGWQMWHGMRAQQQQLAAKGQRYGQG